MILRPMVSKREPNQRSNKDLASVVCIQVRLRVFHRLNKGSGVY